MADVDMTDATSSNEPKGKAPVKASKAGPAAGGDDKKRLR